MQTQHDCKRMREEVRDILGTSNNFLKSCNNTKQSSLDCLLEVVSKIAMHSIFALTFSEIRWP